MGVCLISSSHEPGAGLYVHVRVWWLVRHRGSRVYTNEGLRLSDGADACDCLVVGCPGCHLPCPRCLSPKCGAECRSNRTWFYTEVEMEGSRSKIINDVLLKDRFNPVTNGKSQSQQQQPQQR